MLNLPVGENTAIRLVGFSARDAGFIDNVLGKSLGGTFDNADVVDDDVNAVEYIGGRAAVRWLAGENWTVDAASSTSRWRPAPTGKTTSGGSRWPWSWRSCALLFVDEDRDDEWTQFALTLQGDLGWAPVHVGDQLFHARHLVLPGQHRLHVLP